MFDIIVNRKILNLSNSQYKNEYHIFRSYNTTNGISKGIYNQDQDYENKITHECHMNYDSKTFLAINNSLLTG